MLKVILVDDEPFILRSLQKNVPWNEIGLDVCATAENGIEALEKIAQFMPDIVFTDIRMPQMDGVELSRAIKEKWPDIEIIIISGHDNFEYAQQAVRLGVTEYLLKPTNVDNLVESAKKLRDTIILRKKLKQDYAGMQKNLQQQLPMVKKSLLLSLLFGHFHEDEQTLLKRLEYCKSKLTGKPYYLVKIMVRQNANWDIEQEQVVKLYHQQVLEMIFSSLSPNEILPVDTGWYIIVEENEETDFVADITAACEEIQKNIYNISGQKIFAGISGLKEQCLLLKQAAGECEIALNYCKEESVEQNTVLKAYGDLFCFEQKLECLHYEWIDGLISRIKLLQSQKAQGIVSEMLYEMKKQGTPFFIIFAAGAHVMAELYNLCIGMSMPPEVFSILHRNTISLRSSNSVQNLVEAINPTIALVCEKLSNSAGSINNELIEQIVTYIEDNLGGEISLSIAAEKVHMSKNYFCNLFKKQTGETFINYITERRMQRAKKLLRETTYRISEIADMVGYRDYAYFFQVFKKSTGLSATEYRSLFLSENEESNNTNTKQ